ncbi:xanthine dehydrogenase [candidate division KSB1 bacterium]|nr:xanthine dehydrogenase [candidate division KSB1 bacterium]
MKKQDIFQAALECKQANIPAALATVVAVKGSSPRDNGAKMLIYSDGRSLGTVGGGSIEKMVEDKAQEIIQSGKSGLFDFELADLNMACGGHMSVFIEALLPLEHLVIFGAGHIGKALTEFVTPLGFRSTVVDNRPDFAHAGRLPLADEIIAKPYADAFKEVNLENAYIVIVTHRHLHDQEVLEHCVQASYRYLGMIGSKTKVAKSFQELRDKGVSDSVIESIHSPIGLDIGAETPEEIALAIAAEMVDVRAKKRMMAQ